MQEGDRGTNQDNESAETCVYNVRDAHVELRGGVTVSCFLDGGL